MTKPSPAARVGLIAANLAAAAVCAFVWFGIEALGDPRLVPLARLFLAVGAICLLVGVPGGAVEHKGVRSLSRALAAVGLAAGGAAAIVLQAAGMAP